MATLVERQRGVKFVACTLGKTPALARAGQIPVFVGGEAAAVEQLKPVLAVMANAVFVMGSVEGATMFKLISNLVGMTNLAVLAEGHLLAQAAGIDPATYIDALRTTGGWSVQADIRLKWMMERDFAPRFAVGPRGQRPAPVGQCGGPMGRPDAGCGGRFVGLLAGSRAAGLGGQGRCGDCRNR